MQMANSHSQQQQHSLKLANPYQQLKYLYQTENYEYFFKLVDELTSRVKQNLALKSQIYKELEYLQTSMSCREFEAGFEPELKTTDYLKEAYLLKDKFDLNDVLPSPGSVEANDTILQLRRVNLSLKRQLQEKIKYNEQLIKLIDSYQDSILEITTKLYSLFSGGTDGIRKKLDTLVELRATALEEFNKKIERLEELSKINDLLLHI